MTQSADAAALQLMSAWWLMVGFDNQVIGMMLHRDSCINARPIGRWEIEREMIQSKRRSLIKSRVKY